MRTYYLTCYQSGAAVAYWLGRRIKDRNEDFEREFDSRWWIFFRKFEILSKSCTITVQSCTITAVINY